MMNPRQSIELERRVPERNMARFYVLEIEIDLFGAVLARRRWGRIGVSEQSRSVAFTAESDAWAELRRLEQTKRRRGYIDRDPQSQTGDPGMRK
jgi:predicted DNA-binding WGR domain protein